MVFNSSEFLIFFPSVVLLFFLIPKRFQWVWLLAGSYYFYMSWNPAYVILLLISTVLTWGCGWIIEHSKEKIWICKMAVGFCFSVHLLMLGVFKYQNFILDSIQNLFSMLGVEVCFDNRMDVLLPVGISFYTFQALGYVVDVYRGEKAESNIARYALFVSFFPQLVAGPIERSGNLLHQLRETHEFDYHRVKDGLLLMLWGLFQKLVIADRVALCVNTVYGNWENYSGFVLIIATIFFAFQIYCDFAGYSDIAIGASEVMGIHLMNNFEKPYFAVSVKDFWKRWHISLTSWFRDYLYIPLGGNRKGRIRKYRNIMIVYFVSGIWHGANWTFLAWGGVHGIYQIIADATKHMRRNIIEKLHIKTDVFSWRFLQAASTFLLVDFAWIFFRADSIADALGIIRNMFVWNPWILSDGTLYTFGFDYKDFDIAFIGILLLGVADTFRGNRKIRLWLGQQNIVFRWTIYLGVIFWIMIFGVYGATYDASSFIYFQF